MAKRVTNKDIMEKLIKIEGKLNIGASNALFYFGMALLIAGISLTYIETDSWVPFMITIVGLIIVIASNIHFELLLDRIKKK